MQALTGNTDLAMKDFVSPRYGIYQKQNPSAQLHSGASDYPALFFFSL